jgi:hypothetical protein
MILFSESHGTHDLVLLSDSSASLQSNILELRLGMHGAIPPLLHAFFAWCLINDSDNFKFDFYWLRSYPCNRLWRPIGLWHVEAPIFSRQSAHRWRWCVIKFVSVLEERGSLRYCFAWRALNLNRSRFEVEPLPCSSVVPYSRNNIKHSTHQEVPLELHNVATWRGWL